MNPMVLFHANCNDGFCAAWVFSRFSGGNEAVFIPVQYGDDPPDVIGREVYILDFSFKRPVLEKMKSEARALHVLDHHKTAQEDLAGFPGAKFDLNKSGARMTWEMLHSGDGVPAPWLVDYTEDRDLWRWELPYSKEVNAALFSYPRDFDTWDHLHDQGTRPMVQEGRAILRYQDTVIQSAREKAYEVEFAGYTVPVVNATSLVSEIGQELAKGKPFSVVMFFTKDKTVHSLRSAPDGVDVSEIANRYGGGGHKHAAGFSSLKPALTRLAGFAEGQW